MNDSQDVEAADVDMCLLVFRGVPEVAFPVPALRGLYCGDRRNHVLEAMQLLTKGQRDRLVYLPHSWFGTEPLYSITPVTTEG